MFRGALVYKKCNQLINQDGDVEFNDMAQGYDTDRIHNNTMPDRLTVPHGVKIVQLSANLDIAFAEPFQPDVFFQASITKISNLGTIPTYGLPIVNIPKSPDVRTRINLVSAPLFVSAGDYFKVYVSSHHKLSVDSFWEFSWFAMEIIH